MQFANIQLSCTVIQGKLATQWQFSHDHVIVARNSLPHSLEMLGGTDHNGHRALPFWSLVCCDRSVSMEGATTPRRRRMISRQREGGKRRETERGLLLKMFRSLDCLFLMSTQLCGRGVLCMKWFSLRSTVDAIFTDRTQAIPQHLHWELGLQTM